MKIINKFEDIGITYEEAVSEDATTVPANHYAYNYVWELIDKYSDKYHLYKMFKENEKEYAKTDETYDFIDKLYTDKDFFNDIRLTWYEITHKNTENEAVGFTTQANELLVYVSDKYGDEEWCTKEFLSNFKKREFNGIFSDINEIEKKYMEICAPIKLIKETSFAEAIKERYDVDVENGKVRLPLHSDFNIILNAKKRADSHFLDIRNNFDFEGVTFETQGFDDNHERKLITTEILEKHFNLLQNPKNKTFYISNGQGLMITFSADNDSYIYIPLRKKFRQRVKKKDSTPVYNIIWSRPDFYKLGHQYCSHLEEPESFLVSFNNCFYNAKTKTIYELDYRFPRLPMKRSKQNFIFDQDLTNKGGALEKVMDYCFEERDRSIIFKYLGRALFERGYTQHQEILMFLGKGGTGKTTFATALSKIFDNVSAMSADKMDSSNKFAFSQLPNTDFIVMDEITNAQANFVEMMKLMSNGAEALPIELKNQNTFNLPAEYIPMMVAIGNTLIPSLYKKFAGAAAARRFCILFLKHSMLEAKLIEVDEDGNEIRGAYSQEELFEPQCIEWLIQQIILHYDPHERHLLTEKEANARADMAACPEKWVIENHVEIMRDPNNTNTVSQGDESPRMLAEELLGLVQDKVEEYMLEKTIKKRDDSKFLALLRDAFNIEPINDQERDEKGRLYIRGFIWHDEKLLNDED